MEGLYYLKYPLEENSFLCIIDLKDVYFSVPLCLSPRKLLPLFFIMACSLKIFEIIKGTNSPIEALEHLPSDISRYIPMMWRKFEEILMIKDTLIFLLDHLGFAINLKNQFQKWLRKYIFRPKNRYANHGFSSNREKDEKGYFKISESPFFILKLLFWHYQNWQV